MKIKITEELINAVIGDLISREKYKFADKSLIAEAVRDAIETIKEGK